MKQELVPKPQRGAVYRHYKNNQLYLVQSVSESTVDESLWVVYEALYGKHRTHHRPLEEFVGIVDYVGDKPIYRFTLEMVVVSCSVTDEWVELVQRLTEEHSKGGKR